MEFPFQLSSRGELDNRHNECWEVNYISCWRVANAIKKERKRGKED